MKCHICGAVYAHFGLGPPMNGSMDARVDNRLCEIHYWIAVRLMWAFMGTPWNSDALVAGLTKEGRRVFEQEWKRTRAKVLAATDVNDPEVLP